MQKLLRRNASTPIRRSISNMPATSSFLSLEFNSKYNNSKNFSLGFAKRNRSTSSFLPQIPLQQLKMPAATLLHLHPSAALKNPTTSITFSYLPTKTPNTVPLRAWFHTASDKSFPLPAATVGSSEGVRDLEGADGGEREKAESSVASGSGVKPVRLDRRQGGSSVVGNPDLLGIPGVGPRNSRKLVEKGFSGVTELKQLYKDKFFGKSSQKMVDFLRSSVGITHRNHAESIATFIKQSVDEELKDSSKPDMQPTPKKRLTFCVEGNISVGKTTFLQRIANETLELQDLVEIVPEPVNKWQDVGPDHFNILDAFYAEPQRYAYTFQNYVFVTRVMQEMESSGGIKPLRLMERSVFTDRMVFVRAVHEAKWMNEMEISIYDSWFNPFVSSLPGLVPDAFVYLRASPDTCHKRMLLRNRTEEGGVSLDYLHDLHEKHESWLLPSRSGSHGVWSVSKLPHHMDCSLHADIRDRVFYLEGDHMHSSIQKVPALVLDCEPDIDFTKDIEAKRQGCDAWKYEGTGNGYARQVAAFFEFVKKKKEDPTHKVGEAAMSGQPNVLLGHKGGFWVPNGKHFPEPPLKSLDFERAMSSIPG